MILAMATPISLICGRSSSANLLAAATRRRYATCVTHCRKRCRVRNKYIAIYIRYKVILYFSGVRGVERYEHASLAASL